MNFLRKKNKQELTVDEKATLSSQAPFSNLNFTALVATYQNLGQVSLDPAQERNIQRAIQA